MKGCGYAGTDLVPCFPWETRKLRVHHRSFSQWRWHLGEVFARINGETNYLWRAVGHEGKVLKVCATKSRDRKASPNFLKRVMKRYAQPKAMVTDRLWLYRAVIKEVGNAAYQRCDQWLNNLAENSHQPFRRREGATARFRDVKILQQIASAHALVLYHFNLERHLDNREIFRQNRVAALADWQQIAA